MWVRVPLALPYMNVYNYLAEVAYEHLEIEPEDIAQELNEIFRRSALAAEEEYRTKLAQAESV